MRAIFRVASVLLMIAGVVAVVLALAAFLYSAVTPTQPPPSMNEGPGMAWMIGWLLLLPGGSAVIAGIAMRIALRTTRTPDEIVDSEWSRQHKRL